ncbi:MAG: hypothetical protein ACXW20_20990 [Burkholderiales bacterium]
MIEFSRVTKRYPGGHEALKDATLRVDRGEMEFLTGHRTCRQSIAG